jgi:2,4-dienoyl-CoA reductase-like NADH-dependent reductase (Old Yellow Enzyme family)/thioredoxin reductase/putative sterol carrier protein
LKLFEPIKVGNIEISNRIVMPGMETNYGDEKGNVTDKTIKYYQLRAKGGTGLITVESIFFDSVGRGTQNMLSIESNKKIAGLKKLVDIIKKEGARVIGQVYHAGIQSTSFIQGEQIVGPSDIPSKLTGVIPKPMTKKMIKKTIEGYAIACQRLQKAGFDGVEIHAGHGYLLNQFFSKLYNNRTDEYGGSLENRMRFAIEVLQAIRKKCGENFLICYRINGQDFIEGGLEVEDMAKIAKRLEEEGVDMINITGGIFDSPYYPVVPFMNQPRGVYSKYSAIIKKAIKNVPICVVGRINTPEIAEEILQDNRADMVAMGRAVISDPFLPQKTKDGKRDEIIICTGCNACLNQILIEEQVACSNNPNLLGSYEDIKEASEKKKVLIIGAGPAGLEAAIVAKIRGHEILIIEKDDKIGGNLVLGAQAPMKKESLNFISKYDYLLKKYGVNVKLSTPYTKELLEEFQPDVVILATGSKPSIPEIEGLEGNYQLYTEALAVEITGGEEVALIGGGMIGIEVANYLSSKGKKITIFEETPALGADLYSLVGSEIVQRTLDDDNVTVITDAAIDKIDGKTIYGKQGNQDFSLQFDEIIITTESSPLAEIESEIKQHVSKVFKIGDCKKTRVRKILEAVADGYEIGLTLETAEPPPSMDTITTGEGLRGLVVYKVKTSTFEIADIPDYLEVMVEICNTNEKIQKKSKKSMLNFQFKVIPGPSYWIVINNGKFTTGEGELDSPDVTIEMNKNVAAGIFTGEVNAASAYMSKQIKFIGPLRHGMKFQTWTNTVKKELGLEVD